jgi:hypothetical protein
LKTIITLLIILLAMHACQYVTERYALEKTTSQPENIQPRNNQAK